MLWFKRAWKPFGVRFLVMSSIMMGLFGGSTTVFGFGGGDGSPGDPYQITSCADLIDVNTVLTGHYILTTDLDCAANGSGIMIWDGTPSSYFEWVFEGSGHVIEVAIDVGTSTTGYVALFRIIHGATIKNLTVSGSVNAPNADAVWGIIWYAYAVSDVTNVTAVVNVTWDDNVGWIVGQTTQVLYDNCFFEGNVVGSESVWGLVWSYNEIVLSWSSAIGTVTATDSESYVWGLLWFWEDVELSASFFSGTVQGSGYVGWIIGSDYVSLGSPTSLIENTYAIWIITGVSYVWWIVGRPAGTDVTLTNVYAAVVITWTSRVGAIVGYTGDAGSLTINETFRDSDLANGVGDEIGTGRTTAQMMDIDTFTDAWRDIEITTGDDLNWGYPYLTWQVDATSPVRYLFQAADLMMYMNDNGVPADDNLIHEYRIEFNNTGNPVDDVVIRIEGDLSAANFTVLTGPAISTVVTWSYVERTGISLTGVDDDIYYFTINHDLPGSYVYTATISSDTVYDPDTGNNTFWLTSTVIANATPSSRGGGKASSVKKVSSSSDNDNEDDDDDDDEDDNGRDNDDDDRDEDDNDDRNEDTDDDELLDMLMDDLRDGVEEPTATSDLQCSDDEYNAAYEFGFMYGLTTMPSCVEANMDGTLLRKHAAKMLSNYAVTVLGKEPNMSRTCTFSDMSSEDEEMKKYATLACQLWLMGLAADGTTPLTEFNPNGAVDKAQFATMLSRLLYGNTYNGNTTCRYCDHVAALQKAGIITITSDLTIPLRRAYALIMLMRTKE